MKRTLLLVPIFCLFALCARANADITFCVDVSCYPPTSSVNIFGSFNGWCAPCTPLNDQGGDIWCATINMPDGNQEFKFLIDGIEESFPLGPDPTDGCTMESGPFVNRVITVVNGVPQNVSFGFQSCDATCIPPPGALIDFCVDVSCMSPINSVNIFGGFNSWNPGANPMSDPDNDGIYCASIYMPPGSQEYKFLINGIAEEFPVGPDPSDACTIEFPPFVNRVLTVVDGVPQSVSAGFASCDATCIPLSGSFINFCVDMNCASVPFTDVTIFGLFNGWNPFANFMDDSDGDGIYCTTVFMTAGTQEFKFFAVGDPDPDPAENFPVGPDATDACTIEFPPFVNRIITVEENTPSSYYYDWEGCLPVCSNVATIPTMGQWALIIFGLLLLSFGTVALRRRELVAAGGSNASFSINEIPFDKNIYTRALLTVALGLVIVFALAIALFGYVLTSADVPGSLLAIPIAAYLLHLLLGSKE